MRGQSEATLLTGMCNRDQVTKPIVLVKICYKLLYVIQGIENSFDKVTSWPQLISEFWLHMPVNNVASDWLRTFYTPGVFVYIIVSICPGLPGT